MKTNSKHKKQIEKQEDKLPNHQKIRKPVEMKRKRKEKHNLTIRFFVFEFHCNSLQPLSALTRPLSYMGGQGQPCERGIWDADERACYLEMFSLQLLRPITHTKFHKALYFPWKILQLNSASTYPILDGRGRMVTSKEKCFRTTPAPLTVDK